MDRKTLDESREAAVNAASWAKNYAGMKEGQARAESAKAFAMIYAADVARYNAEVYGV